MVYDFENVLLDKVIVSKIVKRVVSYIILTLHARIAASSANQDLRCRRTETTHLGPVNHLNHIVY